MNTLYMALRVSTSGNGKKSTPAIRVAVAAVALSVAVMLAAIAVVMGFKEEITRKVIAFNPHIVLKANQGLSHGEYLVNLTQPLEYILEQTPYIKSYSLSASAPAIFKTQSDFKGVYLRSLASDETASFIDSQLVSGEFPDFSAYPDKLLISSIAADQLRLNIGDTIPTYFISDRVLVEPLKIAGIFNSHFNTYDDIYAFGSLSLVQRVGNINSDEGTYINIYVDEFDRIPDYVLDLRHRLDQAYASGLIYRYYEIETALTNGANFFSWLSLLDTNVVVILALMTAVALITLISGMMILIVDKQRFIDIMKALGAPSGMIRKVFVWLTVRVAVTGMFIGNLIMLAFLYLQEAYHFLPLDADNYYIDFVPVKLTLASILVLNGAILIVTYFSLLLPARFANRI